MINNVYHENGVRPHTDIIVNIHRIKLHLKCGGAHQRTVCIIRILSKATFILEQHAINGRHEIIMAIMIFAGLHPPKTSKINNKKGMVYVPPSKNTGFSTPTQC